MFDSRPNDDASYSGYGAGSFFSPSDQGASGPAGSEAIEGPVINLPKGGGAIKSIDEKFGVNAVTATASFSIPVPLSKSRSGFIPTVNLSYNSGSGNSEFGLGWQIPIPSISRKTEKQLPQYNDDEDSDTFILSGAEDLVPLLEKQPDGSWKKYNRTKSENGVDYWVKRYRPRIEGLFARIEKWTQKTNGVVHWRSVTNKNIHSYYGQTAQSRISDPHNPGRVAKWLLDRTHDDKGNIFINHFKTEDFAGVENKLCEKNKINNCTQAYLKKIVYGNKTPYYLGDVIPGENDFMFKVVFDYGEHDTAANVPLNIDAEIKPWACRKDPFSSYRSGFEIRTYRRCERILLFHCFDELPHSPYLTKSLQLFYDDTLHLKGGASSADGFSFLVKARQNGHRWDAAANSYKTKHVPETELIYQQHEWNTEVKLVTPESLVHAPVGLSDKTYLWIDLYSEGIAGILTEKADAWLYKSNLGNGKFSPAMHVAPKPSFRGLGSGKLSIRELEGNGIKYLVQIEKEPRGFFKLTEEEVWEPMRTFEVFPNIDQDDRNMRSVDLNGDGIADLLITEDDKLRWYAGLGEKGFEVSETVFKEIDDEKGPALVFSDLEGSIFLADMSGDGLTDIVRVRNGEICYWPNLGYGRFGAKVNMDRAPLFDHADAFNPSWLRFADIDGSGTTDVVYLGKNDFRVWMNLNGNQWTKEPQIINPFPSIDNVSDISLLDFLGAGTSCIVFSSPVSNQPMQYIDLMGSKKPGLFCGYINNCGKEVALEYKSSTFFYLKDKLDGNKWITKLPFPVHCISKVTVKDRVRGTEFTTSYSYRHGYYDYEEREYRGFARVEQLDTENFEQFKLNAANNVVEEDLHQPPVCSVSWFHTGAYLRKKKILDQCETEYFKNAAFPEHKIPEPHLPAGLTAEETREAYRACKGVPLRVEVYANDGGEKSKLPYSVSYSSVEIRLVQPKESNRFASFLVVPSESVSYNYDRNPADPRVSQSFILEADEFGNVVKSCSISHKRFSRPLGSEAIPDKVWDEQKKTHIAYNESFYTKDKIDDALNIYRLRTGCECRSYEINGLNQPLQFYFSRDDFFKTTGTVTKIIFEDYSEILFEEDFDGTTQKRLSSHSRRYFYKDDLSGPLPLGELSALGILCKINQLAFTKNLVSKFYNQGVSRVSDLMLADAKYVHSEGDDHWWTQPGQPIYAANPRNQFYIPIGARDVFGNESFAEFDSYTLLIKKTVDAIGNFSTAENDYRTLSPILVTDPNLNRAAVETDELGLVIKSAMMGKAGSGEGDTLADPTSKMEYDPFNWQNNGKPNYVHVYAREQHGAANPRWQESYVYSDGSGAVVMSKVQANPGKAKKWNPLTNTIDEVDADPRWIGNGRTIFNNKGKVVKKYEPYFSTTFDYESEESLVETGVTAISYYDPIGRNYKTEFPNGTYSKAEFTPWKVRSFDVNDTVKDSSWYADRGSPDPAGPEPADEETRAAWLAAKHHDTPVVTHLDSIGNGFYKVADLGNGKTQSVYTLKDLNRRFEHSYDQLDRKISETYFNLLGRTIYATTAEKGERWGFVDVMGRLVRLWDNDAYEMYCSFDELSRPLSSYVKHGNDEVLFDHVVYGDLFPVNEAIQRNLKGKVYQKYDQAGVVTIEELDFKGIATEVNIRLATVNFSQQLIDWSSLEALDDITAIHAAADLLLEDEVFTSTSVNDALNRPVVVTLPDGSVVQPKYNEANFLASLKVKIRGQGGFVTFLESQDYDAKGQRQFVKYGNSTITNYFYDPLTFRLTDIVTKLTENDTISKSIQNLQYHFDPIGNITQISDDAQQTHFFKNAVVFPENKYEYDAIYQLKKATGREHAGIGVNVQRSNADHPVMAQLPHDNDPGAVRNYIEQYEYDDCGNIKQLKHTATNANWTQRYQYEYEVSPGNTTNRLKATSLPGDGPGIFSATYTHNLHGNMSSMPHLPAANSMKWNFTDQLREVNLGGGGTAYYIYGLGGNRVRKIIVRQGGVRAERIYLGAVEIYRERQGTADPYLERYTLHVSDTTSRIAQVDTKTIDTDGRDVINGLNENLIRYQYDNHLGSASLETDLNGNIISYEEYHPYGTSSYRLSKPDKDVGLKRYRFSDKEYDDETGFYYFGARYYASWLGRWTSSDPAGFAAGPNLFRYCSNSPVMFHDPNGMDEILWQAAPPEMAVNTPAGRQQAIDFLNTHYVIGSVNGVRYRVQVNVTDVTWIEVPEGQGTSHWQGSEFTITSSTRIDPADPNQPAANSFEPIQSQPPPETGGQTTTGGSTSSGGGTTPPAVDGGNTPNSGGGTTPSSGSSGGGNGSGSGSGNGGGGDDDSWLPTWAKVAIAVVVVVAVVAAVVLTAGAAAAPIAAAAEATAVAAEATVVAAEATAVAAEATVVTAEATAVAAEATAATSATSLSATATAVATNPVVQAAGGAATLEAARGGQDVQTLVNVAETALPAVEAELPAVQNAVQTAAPAVQNAAQAASPWLQNPFVRGRLIENTLNNAAGGGGLPSNFPTVDRWLNGVATSVKSIDLNAPSYQNMTNLTSRLQGYVDSVSNFAGRTNWAGASVPGNQIVGRALEIAIPAGGGSPAQMNVLQQIVQYGANATNTVNVTIIQVP